MSNNGFDFIAQALVQQKQAMDVLQRENRELRRQIADLQAGHGIFIEIEGRRFPIKGEIAPPQSTTRPAYGTQQDFLAAPPTYEPRTPVSQQNERQENTKIAPTPEFPPLADPFAAKEMEKAPTFLEEIMLDEFATASTSPMTASKGTANNPPEPIDEEKKAALRRELMGSFLLE